MANKIKLLVALLLVSAGVYGCYYLQDSAQVLRVLSVLVGISLAVVVALTGEQGKRFLAYVRASIAEMKRVVWPTRKETTQTTMVVLAFAVVMALFLWAVDASLMVVIDKLMGRGE